MAKAILLFSEGLDSCLAGLILKRESFEVIAVRFITSFFGWQYKEKRESFDDKIKTLGFDQGIVEDISQDFLKILQCPKHGRGDLANPCIDCKILLLRKAKELMVRFNADFIATGEVLGQRPMSQNRSALELIEREAGVQGLVVRPLSAKLLKDSEPEKKGLINRDNLFDHQGKSRVFQINLAKNLGLKEIPTPAGGCLLTDPTIGKRVLKVIKERRPLDLTTAELLTFGRHFFDGALWVVMGRREEENLRIKKLILHQKPLYTLDIPSPVLAVIEGNPSGSMIKELLIRHSKKAQLALAEGREPHVLKIDS
ncbi:MAG: hypothetical protein N2Z40_04715 [Caldimicrobium sp.]|nr:hypothetical protein [Caldimicrobium sp.]MCX7613504.1 hypothetical protein [Caldimicrobium sp.]MDW8182572.1 hypothetical protein [Caldimicrobium sp.]